MRNCHKSIGSVLFGTTYIVNTISISDHHNLHQIMKTIFLLCMFAHLLRNLFLCKNPFL